MGYEQESLVRTAEPHPGRGQLSMSALLPKMRPRLDRRFVRDKRAEKQTHLLGPLTAFLGLASTAAFGMSEIFNTRFGGQIGPFLLIGFVSAFGYLVYVLRADINDRKLDAVRGTLHLLEELIDHRIQIRTLIDFESYEHAPLPRKDDEDDEEDQRFNKPWLELSLQLTDQTKVEAEAQTACVRHERERNLRRPDGSRSPATYRAKRDEIIETLKVKIEPLSDSNGSKPDIEAPSGMSLQHVEAEDGALIATFMLGPAVRIFEQGADPTRPQRVEWRGEHLERLISGHSLAEAIRACHDAARTASPEPSA